MQNISRTILGVVPAWSLAFIANAHAGNFTTGTDSAVKFGVHEIFLTGDGHVTKPLDTLATITFTPPTGARHGKKVLAFYDGKNCTNTAQP